MTINKIIKIKELEKYIEEEFGKCKDDSFGCCSCEAMALFYSIKRFVIFCQDCEDDIKRTTTS